MLRNNKEIRTFFGNTLKDYYKKGDDYYTNPEVAFFSSEIMVERAGYKPVRLQVIDFLSAGERLIASRNERYYQSQVDKLENNDLPLPETRKAGFDLNDAYRANKAYNEKLSNLNKLIEERKEMKRLQQEKEFADFQEWKKSQTVTAPVDTANVQE